MKPALVSEATSVADIVTSCDTSRVVVCGAQVCGVQICGVRR